MSGNIQVVLEGKGAVTLRDSNYVASGGEGTVYKISDSVVKLYHRADVARQNGIAEKIKLLSGIKHPYISSPTGLVSNPAGDVIGHFLPYVDGHPLSKVFTNDFWQREGFTDAHASTLVDRMKQIVQFAHQNKAVLVDANELNYFTIFSGSNPEPRIIDVDSWSIGKWPATVIMPSIRDWHSNSFNEKTDWFAWGIVTFQIYTGLHPYKGTLDSFGRSDLLGRMKANASVFSKGVRLNRAVRDFSKIPSPLLDWYEATFQKGERVIPPSPFDTGVTTSRAARTMRIVTTGRTGLLVLDKLIDFAGDPALKTFHCGVALLSSGKLVNLRTTRVIGEVKHRNCEVIKVKDGWLVAEMDKKTANLQYIEEASLKSNVMNFNSNGHHLVSYEDRLFLVTDNGLTEIKLTVLGKPIASLGHTWGAMLNSTKWFQGVGIMDAMGAKYAITPFGESSVVQERIRELDDIKVVNAKSGNRFVSVVGINKKGEYRRVEIVFSRDYKTNKVSVVDADNAELNLAILPKGVSATILKDGEVDIFVPTNGQVTRVEDKDIGTDMLLSNWGDKVIYIQNGAVWSMRLK